MRRQAGLCYCGAPLDPTAPCDCTMESVADDMREAARQYDDDTRRTIERNARLDLEQLSLIHAETVR